MTWLTSAFFALFSFGLWGFFSKFSVMHLDAKSALVYQTLGVLLTGLLMLCFMKFKPAVDTKGISFALLTGVAYGIGCFFYLMAASKGKLITVVTLTALYPLITMLLAYWLLKESITFKQCIGIILAISAIVLLSS
ncbi:MAG: GRP family sugar transporter [Pseudomonadota bacterium]